MTELAFAKQFLSALDARPMRISPDHVVDAREYPAQPAFVLPKPSSGPRLRRARPSSGDRPASSSPTAASAAASSGTTVTLKPTRPSSSTLTLTIPTPQPPHTSMHALKTAYATASGLPIDKIKLLHKKKPVSDTKTLKDVVGDAASEVEFSVMVMGGAAAATASASASASASPANAGTPERVASPGVSTPSGAAEGPLAQPIQSGEQVAESESFWSDLEGFLAQRVKDEGVAKRMAGVFRGTWEKKEQAR